MKNGMYDNLQVRELFHLEFLRSLGRRVKPEYYALKGGANLRFFFKSFRFSEDMDLDACVIPVQKLKDTVMDILNARSFVDNLKAFNISRIIPPDMMKAKQTETTQRFKVHLITDAGEDLFTKVEFSRRAERGDVVVEPINDVVLRAYKLAPLLVPHYGISAAVSQKIGALAGRAVTQARDIFDLFILSTQYNAAGHKQAGEKEKTAKAHERIFTISYEQFRDTVVSYFSAEDQAAYNNASMWDEVKLKTAQFLEEIAGLGHG